LRRTKWGLPRISCGRRDSQHPDAQWLASLLPAGDVTNQSMLEVMTAKQREDARASFFVWALTFRDYETELLEDAAERGYAHAQAQLADFMSGEEDGFRWAQRAASKGDRLGMNLVAPRYHRGYGCEKDTAQATEWYKAAAELGCAKSQFQYGRLAFDKLDWRRYYWYALGAKWNVPAFRLEVKLLLPSFAKGENGRILHTVAPVICANLNVAKREVFGDPITSVEAKQPQQVMELHDTMLRRARRAIACWSMAGRRCGVVKDIRIMIAKMAWAEAWQWGEKGSVEEVEPKRLTRASSDDAAALLTGMRFA
jgi:hypothetical protein